MFRLTKQFTENQEKNIRQINPHKAITNDRGLARNDVYFMFCSTAFWDSSSKHLWSCQIDFCTSQQVFWPTPEEQTAPVVWGLKGTFSSQHVSAPSPDVWKDLDQGSRGHFTTAQCFFSKSFFGVFCCLCFGKYLVGRPIISNGEHMLL